MARYTGPACRLCRREGTKLFLKGDRCLSEKCSVSRRALPPGPHSGNQKKPKEYGMQLREKQKAKRYYGVLETQFKNYFVKADKQPGVTGTNLLSLLERRLDNVVYRMGIGDSRREARQYVTHGHFAINGRKVDIPSYIVKPGEVIELRERARKVDNFKEFIETLDTKITPKWMELDVSAVSAKIVAIPQRDDIDFPFEEQLIVELYSK